MNVNPRFAIVKSRILMELSNMDRLFMELHTRGFGNDVPQRKLLLSDPFMLRAVIHQDTVALLNEFRGFRPIFRNIYGFNLVGERMERLLKILPGTLDMLKKDLSPFIVEMEEVLLNP